MRALTLAILIPLCTSLIACGDDKETPTNNTQGQDMAAGVDMKSSVDMPPTDPDQGGPDMSAQADMDQDMAVADMSQEDMATSSFDAPVEKDALFSWLQARSYEQFPNDGTIHPASSAHGRAIKVFFNKTLDDSIKANNASHPVGSVSVKEMYTPDMMTLRGWAVSVKTQADSAGGQGWYWYEVFSTTSGASPVAAGQGVSLCTGCHSSAARDFVYWPQ